jgi:hypothetical protein
VVGTGVLKVFRLSEQTLKQQPLNANRRDTLSFTCQAWVPLGDKGADAAAGSDAAKAAAGDRERQLLGTLDGEILMFEVCCNGLLLRDRVLTARLRNLHTSRTGHSSWPLYGVCLLEYFACIKQRLYC